ncbi:hypothetical protein N7474_007496 [Penicillium riverlandense]|uniref:uncharacterized protein n=1 Tax=Penicillium riverlandense TaxID=1903569 RepID=UPI002549B3F3|nr:uncharacterized protein N7474_007496 [Penicillium riverlandense]KAJ5815719.1 hypothetical protein N7474_007496 [Penicillium riverlandense]
MGEVTPKGKTNKSDASKDNRDQGQPNKEDTKAKRELKRWTEDDSTILLLCLQFQCNQESIKLPWPEVAKLIPGPVTESSIIQHLAKLRTRRIAEDKWIPPPLKRSAAAGKSKKAGTRKKATAKNTNAKETDATEDSEVGYDYAVITDKKFKDTVTMSLHQKRGKHASDRKQTKDAASKFRGQKRRNDSRLDSDPEFEPTSSRRRHSAPKRKDTTAKGKGTKEDVKVKTGDSKGDNESDEECEKRLLCVGAPFLRFEDACTPKSESTDSTDSIVSRGSAEFSPTNETSTKILRLKVPRISDLLNPTDPASTDIASVVDIPVAREHPGIQDDPWLYQPQVSGRTTRYVRHDINPYVSHPSLSTVNMPMMTPSWASLSNQYLQDPQYSTVGTDMSSLSLPPITSTNNHWPHGLPDGFANHDENAGPGQQGLADNRFPSDFSSDFGTPDFWA